MSANGLIIISQSMVLRAPRLGTRVNGPKGLILR
jgi:hypothetical protein